MDEGVTAMSKQTFIVTIEDAPETRWIKQEFLPEKLSRAVEGVVSGATEGKIPRVKVSPGVLSTRTRSLAGVKSVHPPNRCNCGAYCPPCSMI
jgi:hypothetical protein